MAKASSLPKKVNQIVVRMYRAGTGDFFVLKFLSGSRHTFTLMIDCGCINGGKATFQPLLQDLATYTKRGAKSIVDLLVVTHQHEDHLNGFEKGSEAFKNIRFKKVWFAWTEDDQDPQANQYRRTQGKLKKALHAASVQLQEVVHDPTFRSGFNKVYNGSLMYESQKYFADALMELTVLNSSGLELQGAELPTMRDLLDQWNVIKEDTVVEYLNPGDLVEDLEGALGLRFFILGPPRERDYLLMEDKEEDVFEKRAAPSAFDASFMHLFLGREDGAQVQEPFLDKFYLREENSRMVRSYRQKEWRKIDHDWLFSAGSLALKLYKNINNTSLAFALQFKESEKVLLFPGDAELGSWLSWHDGVKWTVRENGQPEEITPEYLLNHTVFYKVSHHLSQNGTAARKGLDLMTSSDLTAMATLDFKKILTGWRNTMPNDFLGAALIEKTKGNLFFVGDREDILRNIKTERVTVRQAYVDKLNRYNAEFDGKVFIDCRIKGERI